MIMEKQCSNRFEYFLASSRCAVWRHLAIQLLLAILSLNVFGTSSGLFVFDAERSLLWLTFYGMLNIVCYLNMYVFVPCWFLVGKMGKYVASIGISVLGSMFLIMLLQPDGEAGNSFSNSLFFIVINLFSSFLSICVVIVSTTTLRLFHYWSMEQQRVRELEIATKNAELAFLKSQINPHFLFNTLNNANVLLRCRSTEASFVLFKLEDLLRYQLDDCRRESVLLVEDIRFLNDYLNLEKIRRDSFRYTCTQEGAVDGIQVPPLLFIPFVENAVKHNPDSGAYVSLSFVVCGGRLNFCCENTKPEVGVKNSVGGLGLNNIRRRLALLYPGRHTLEIEDSERDYRVCLTIDMD